MPQPEPTPFAQTLLRRALPTPTADEYYTERAIKRPLYLRPTSPEPSARALRRRAQHAKKAAAQKHRALKPGPLSAAKKRSLGLLEIPKSQIKWSTYAPLHELWLGYIRDVLGVAEGRATYVTPASVGPLIASADMHGAKMEVVRSRCVSRVGIKGIVVRDSQYTFEIVTEKDKLKTVPKEHTWFRMEIPVPGEEGVERKPLVFEINGEQFQYRAPDRANKKMKMHYQADI
ncbi:ribonuclease-like protein P complex subunit Pop4 [Sporormia fimetaria CBS 119925]|uniref:Ribonuclease P protein subunit n=1 Tax=Sporormia fimetaria CBS 119925 TaxID=1340428 RepID=A0A6A6V1C0_9PLEO|nr:ribonuclease-like protein P complex subunit Pop4 [Sporormia fimetaria CBS 119925]